MTRRSGFANRIIYNLLRLTTRQAPNDPEIVKGRAIACTIQLGSISSLRCQKSRMPRSGESSACEVIFRGRHIARDRAGFLTAPSPFERQRRLLATPRLDPRLDPRLAEPKQAKPAEAGGARRDRTDDLMLAKHALSQLSYGPVSIPNNGALLRPSGFHRACLAL